MRLPPNQQGAPARHRVPRGVSVLEGLPPPGGVSVAVPEPRSVSPPVRPKVARPLSQPNVRTDIAHGSKRARVPRFVQEMRRDADHHVPGPVDQPHLAETVHVDSDEVIDPLIERRNCVLSDAVTVDGDTDLRSFVCNVCDDATDTTCHVGKQTHVRVSGRRCPVVRAGCRTCLESNGKPCPVV